MNIIKVPQVFQIVVLGDKDFYEKSLYLILKSENYHVIFANTIDDLKNALVEKNVHMLLIDIDFSPIGIVRLSEIVLLDYPDIMIIAFMEKKEQFFDIYDSMDKGLIHFYLYKDSSALEYKVIIKMAVKKYCDMILNQELLFKVKTNNQKLEEDVKKQTIQLERLIKERNKYFKFIVHELKGPLTSIQGSLDVLLNDLTMSEDKKNFLTLIHYNTQEIVKMLNSILDFSKSEQNKIQINIKPFDFYTIFPRIETIYHIIAKKKSLDLRFDFKHKNSFSEIFADQDKIEMAVSNIISNAIKYTDSGSITVSEQIDDKNVILIVKDTGRGIAKNEMESIFEIYQRGNFTKDIEGSGLGLAFAKQIIESHGGKIWAESDGLNKGASFYIRIPIKPTK